MTRDQYAQHPTRAAYYWSVYKNGIILAEEYTNTSANIPLSAAGLTLCEGNFRNDLDETLQVHCKPYRGGEGFPAFYLDIAPGESLIWKHLVQQVVGLFGHGHSEPVEYMIFGRVAHDGTEFVIAIDWLGNYAKYDTEEELYKALSVK